MVQYLLNLTHQKIPFQELQMVTEHFQNRQRNCRSRYSFNRGKHTHAMEKKMDSKKSRSRLFALYRLLIWDSPLSWWAANLPSKLARNLTMWGWWGTRYLMVSDSSLPHAFTSRRHFVLFLSVQHNTWTLLKYMHMILIICYAIYCSNRYFPIRGQHWAAKRRYIDSSILDYVTWH